MQFLIPPTVIFPRAARERVYNWCGRLSYKVWTPMVTYFLYTLKQARSYSDPEKTVSY